MSDFLARLADRARGDAAAAVRPRLPSLFEPGARDASPPAEIGDLGAAPPAARARHASVEDDGYRGPLATFPPVSDQIGSHSIGTPPTPVGDESVARSEALRSPTPSAPLDAALRTTPIRGHTIPEAERAASTEPAAVGVSASVARARASLATAAAESRAPAADAALPRRGHPGPVEPRRAHTGRRAMEDESGSPGAPEAAASPPTVRVTIGRIEVRMVAEAPAPASPIRRPAPPRLELDDYLRQRARGER